MQDVCMCVPPPTPGDAYACVRDADAAARAAHAAAAPHTCGICFEARPGRDGLELDCRHWFCLECLQQLAEVAITGGHLAGLRCPEPACAAPFLPHTVRRVAAAAELYARWEDLALARSLETMEDIGHCPRCGAHCVLEEDFAQCPGCYFAFCTLCRCGWHPGSACMSAEQRLEVLRKRAESGALAAEHAEV